MIKFSVNGTPQPKGSGSRKLTPARCPCCRSKIPLRSGIGRLGPYVESADMATKTSKANRLKRWSALVKRDGGRAMSAALAAPIAGPVEIRARFRLEKPPSVKRLDPTVKPDLDKLGRAVQDALEGIAYPSDGQICNIVSTKIYAPSPGVDIEIVPIDSQIPLL